MLGLGQYTKIADKPDQSDSCHTAQSTKKPMPLSLLLMEFQSIHEHYVRYPFTKKKHQGLVSHPQPSHFRAHLRHPLSHHHPLLTTTRPPSSSPANPSAMNAQSPNPRLRVDPALKAVAKRRTHCVSSGALECLLAVLRWCSY